MMTVHSGNVQYRSRLTTLEVAARFARMISRNSRFVGVEIVRSNRAKSEAAWFVAFVPSNPERVEEMIERQGEKDQAKADAEGADFEISPEGDGHRVFNPRTQKAYHCTEHQCSCPHFTYRLAGMAGAACGHMREAKRRTEDMQARQTISYALPVIGEAVAA